MKRNQKSRRHFLVSGVGASVLVSGVGEAKESNQKTIMKTKADELRKNLVECLGGPWPEPCALNPQKKEIIQKDGYRIESLRCKNGIPPGSGLSPRWSRIRRM